MTTSKLNAALTSGEVIQLPLFSTRFVLIYSIPGLYSYEDGVILDYPTMSDIWMGKITNWNHPSIALLNPDLASAGRLPDLNITRIVSTAGARESERIYFTVLNNWTKGTPHEYNITRDDKNGNKFTCSSFLSLPSLEAHLSLCYSCITICFQSVD
jgi:ABC-type phosphate transport system substrate-binding protein